VFLLLLIRIYYIPTSIQIPMHQHETTAKILTKLNKSLSEAHTELFDWKEKLVAAQKYDMAAEFNELNREVEKLMERVSGILRDEK
jgi:ATP-dependent Lon protease